MILVGESFCLTENKCGNGDAGKTVKKVIRLTLSYNFNPFSRTMTSSISTENITPGAHL